MSLFHFHVGQVKRSKGQSAVAAAAYRAGEKLYSEYYGEVSDFTRKGGVICSEILLPPQAPAAYKDLSTLWNAVEKAERGKKAQLAYSFDIALQNELTMEENIALARRFLMEQFVSKGMVVDFAVHAPDKKDGGIANPHFHVLCPIRPIDENGLWGKKQRRVYRLDENGNPILGEDGKPLFDAVPTTDWGKPETLEAWREAWATMVNAIFEEKGFPCRIDHRSYERQGSDQIPTVHEGVAVRQMEARGIITDKGELNRWIRSTNSMIANLRRKIRDLLAAIRAVREELAAQKSPNLGELLGAYYQQRNAGAYSQKAKSNNLKEYAAVFAMLQKEDIATLDDLEQRVSELDAKASKLNDAVKAKSARMKELDSLIHFAEDYKRLRHIIEKLNTIKFKIAREKYSSKHDEELRRFYLAQRKLREAVPKGKAIPLESWKQEREQLQQEYTAARAGHKSLWDKYKQFVELEAHLKIFVHDQERKRTSPKRQRETEL